MRPMLALAVFVMHMLVSLYLLTLPSTPKRLGTPGLEVCQPTEYGYYEAGCMTRNSDRIEEYVRNSPPTSDYQSRDAVAIGLGLLVGLIIQHCIGANRARLAIAGAAYTIPILFGIIPLPAALALVTGSVGMLLLSALLNKKN